MIDTFLVGAIFGLFVLMISMLLCRVLRLPKGFAWVIYFLIEFAGLFWALNQQGIL